jgi:hypothetical protein
VFCCWLLYGADDPFKGLLSNTHAAGSSHPAAASSSSGGGGGGGGRFLLPPDPLTDASASMAAAFSRQDVTNLLAVLANKVRQCCIAAVQV